MLSMDIGCTSAIIMISGHLLCTISVWDFYAYRDSVVIQTV